MWRVSTAYRIVRIKSYPIYNDMNQWDSRGSITNATCSLTSKKNRHIQ